MRDAIAAFVHDGDTVVIEGFTHLDLLRRRPRDHPPAPTRPDAVPSHPRSHLRPNDRAGCARKLVFSWAGNPGAGSLHAFRRAVEGGSSSSRAPSGPTARPTGEASADATGDGRTENPSPDVGLEIEEYSHFGMVARFSAGAARLPFWPLRDYAGTDLPSANPRIRRRDLPLYRRRLATVPALNPDVTIVHAQRADSNGNTQIWGLLGVQKEAAFAARHVVVVVEELVDERSFGPTRTGPSSRDDRRRRRRRALGCASIVCAGVLRPGQRFLRRPGSRFRATPLSSARVSRTVCIRPARPRGIPRARAGARRAIACRRPNIERG